MSRQRAAEWFRSDEKNITQAGRTTELSAIRKFGEVIDIGSDFSRPTASNSSKQAQGIHTDVAISVIDSLGASPSLSQGQSFNLSICSQTIDPRGAEAEGHHKLVNTHFPRFTGLVRVGLLVAIKTEAAAATNQVIRLSLSILT